MDQAIERIVSECESCQENRGDSPTVPLHPWEYPDTPWSQIHADFAGPFFRHMFLIIADSYSKWMDIHMMQSITSEKTIEKFQEPFTTHGLPEILVTDNGTSFTSVCQHEQYTSHL